MKRAALLGLVVGTALAVTAFLAGGAPTASADAGPHVATGSDATPDKCASCHRIHTGQNEYLLKEAGTVEAFCYSCHGNGGPGSDLAVTEGKYYGVGSLTQPVGPPYGGKLTFGALRGGGFESALIKTTDPTAGAIGTLATGQPTKSWHTIDGTTAGTLWGNGALNSGAGTPYTLDCGSCHNPHGNGQYRILRPAPAGSGAVAVNVTDQPNPKNYGATNYLQMGVDVSLTQISSWCATCHTRYLASASPPTNSGDAIYKYRHQSDGNSNRACITCHASHGSNALMPGINSSTIEWPGGGVGTTDNNNSRLLKMNNRGICIKCHIDK